MKLLLRWVRVCSFWAVFPLNSAVADAPGGKNILDLNKPVSRPTSQPASRAIAAEPTHLPATKPSIVDSRHPVPTAAEMVEASKLVDDLFGDEFVKAATFDQKIVLSEKNAKRREG